MKRRSHSSVAWISLVETQKQLLDIAATPFTQCTEESRST